MKQKRLIMMLAVLAAAGAAMAQGNGQAGITEATQLVTGYFDPGTKLVYAVGAIIGLIGGVKVYQKFSSGDPDTSKTASSWFGACIFLIVAATILMSDFEINKGVGREVEFKGLRAQYLFIFAFGLLAVFVVFVIMYTAGIGQWTCIGFGVSAATAVVWLTFSLNRRFGSHGLMKLLAARQHPRRILSRKRITRLIKQQQS